MGSTDDLQAFSNTVVELSNEYIGRFQTHENVTDLLKTVASQTGGIELFENDGVLRVKGSWQSVTNAHSTFIKFLRSYSEKEAHVESRESFFEQDEKVMPMESDVEENVSQNLTSVSVTSVEDEVMEYLNRKAVASYTVPITRKRSFVNGKPNTFSSATSIPDPIVLISSTEQNREFSGTPAVQSTSKKKSIKVLRDLYDIDKNLKSFKKSPNSQGKKKSLNNKKIKTKIFLNENSLVQNNEQVLEENPTETKLAHEDLTYCNEVTVNGLTTDNDSYSGGEDNTAAIDCVDSKEVEDDITFKDDDHLDPDYNVNEKRHRLKRTKRLKKETVNINKIKTRSSTKKEIKELQPKKGRGRQKKSLSKNEETLSKFTSTKKRTSETLATAPDVKKEKREIAGRDHPKLRDSKNVNKEYSCKACPYVTSRKFHLKEHERRCHITKMFKCEICNKIFGFGKDLNRHKLTHLKPENCCDICGKLYKGLKTLAQHKLTHDSEYVKPEFSCEVCNKSFSTKYVLAYHIKSEHLGMKRRFICPTCGKSFSQKNSYIQHANVHVGYKPFHCDICGKAFSYDKSLKEHKFMHDEKKRFTCPLCGKAFRQSSAITIHMKVHKETKDYVCSACGKGFSQKQALVRHERIHLGEKPFVCLLCERTFTDSSVLRRHMILIHKKDPKKWKEDTKQNTVRRADFFISVIGDNNTVSSEKDNNVHTGRSVEDEYNVVEESPDVKHTINLTSSPAATQDPPVDLLGLAITVSHDVATLQANQQQQHLQTSGLNIPVEVTLVNSSQQQFQASTSIAEIIPKAEMHMQNTVILADDQNLSSNIEHVDSKAHLHLLDQRGDGFISETHPSVLQYSLVGTSDYSYSTFETQAAFASACNKGNFPQAQYVVPNTTTANPYQNYHVPDG